MLELKMRKIQELKPHPKNPRKHPIELLEKLEESIKTYGFTNPVLIDKNDIILAGHARCKTAERMGITEVPTLTLDMDETTADAYVIADNKLNELSEWNEEKLVEILHTLKGHDFSLTATGFDAPELEMLIGKKEFDEVPVDEVIDAQAKDGELWMLGNHRLYVGKDISILTNEVRVNLAICQNTILPELAKWLTQDGSVYIIHKDEDGLGIRQEFVKQGFTLSSALVWKQPPSKAKKLYQKAHLTILYGWLTKGTHKWYADRKQTTVFESVGGVTLRANLIRNSTQTNGTVLGADGDTLIACEQLNRRAFITCDADTANETINRYLKIGGGTVGRIDL